jgi:hypothetical protein
VIEARILETGRWIEKAQVSRRTTRRPLRQRVGRWAAEGGDDDGAGHETAAGEVIVGLRYRMRSQIRLP